MRHFRRNRFSLVEMLVVIAIIIVLLSIGSYTWNRMAREATLTTRAAHLHQIVAETADSARRNQIPTQVKVKIPIDPLIEPCSVVGTVGTLISYWGFEQDWGPGFLGQTVQSVPGSGVYLFDDGFVGMGAIFEKATIEVHESFYHLFRAPDGFYMEAAIRPSYDLSNNGTIIEAFGAMIGIEKGTGIWLVFANKSGDSPKSILPADGQWHRLGVMVALSTTTQWDMSFYIDGAYGGGKTNVGAPNNNYLKMGSGGYHGLIDEVKVYSYSAGREMTTDPRDSMLKVSPQPIVFTSTGTLDVTGNAGAASISAVSLSVALRMKSFNGTVIEVEPHQFISSYSPDGGYLVIDSELIKYISRNGFLFDVTGGRNFGGSAPPSAMSPNTLVYLAKPVVINRNGSIQ